jgi:small-conductance mechanosensitive channel
MIPAMIVIFGLLAAGSGAAQSFDQAPAPTPTPHPTAIPAPEIPSIAAADADRARLAAASAGPSARLLDIQSRFPGEQDRIEQLHTESMARLKMPGPASMLKEIERSWERARDRLDRWLSDLASESSALDESLDGLETRLALWRLTRDSESSISLPPALMQQINDTIKALTDAEREVRSARDTILSLQAQVAQQKSDVDEMAVKLHQEISKRTMNVVGIDSPPIWKIFGVSSDHGSALQQIETARKTHWRSLENFVADQRRVLWLWFVIWPALTVFMIAMRRKAEIWAQQDPSLKKAVALLSRPLSAALVLTSLFFTILEPQAPSAWIGLVNLIVLLAVIRLLSNLLIKPLQPATSFVVLLFVLRQAVGLAPEGFPIYRLALLALAGGGIATCIWLFRTLRANPDALQQRWRRPARLALLLSAALFSIGAIADIVGSVGFASLVLTGTSTMMLAGFVWWLIAVMLRSVVRVALLTKTARRIGIAPAHSEIVRTTCFRVITFATVVGWIMVTLRGFLLLDPILTSLRGALSWSVKIGDFSIQPGDLLIFALVIWASFKIAAFIEFVFTVDVVPRTDLPKGVPETISRLASYVVIAIGAVVASAAAGFDIGKVTLIVGALGVGIGFGLQNIVSNFISGLILLFERPIRVGDILEIDNTRAEVQAIGMRASTVRTIEGAELIVPNADLISHTVINWTLSNDRRRMKILVGIAYDSDPEKAAEIIAGVATGHKDVDPQPEPTCLFIGFGDSSLDFELRAWTPSLRFRRVASELRFEIFRQLSEAGIEIPFPQRDVHIRSASTEESLSS